MTTRITAYGSQHTAVTYAQAAKMAEHAKTYGVTICLARIGDDVFELLSMEDEYRVDSEYVTLEVGRRLYAEGKYGVMVLWGGPDDEPMTEEDFAARREAQVYGARAP